MNGRLFTEEQAEAMDETLFSSCRGPCDQGKRLCPCPEACHVPVAGRHRQMSTLQAFLVRHQTVLTVIAAFLGGVLVVASK